MEGKERYIDGSVRERIHGWTHWLSDTGAEGLCLTLTLPGAVCVSSGEPINLSPHLVKSGLSHSSRVFMRIVLAHGGSSISSAAKHRVGAQ